MVVPTRATLLRRGRALVRTYVVGFALSSGGPWPHCTTVDATVRLDETSRVEMERGATLRCHSAQRATCHANCLANCEKPTRPIHGRVHEPMMPKPRMSPIARRIKSVSPDTIFPYCIFWLSPNMISLRTRPAAVFYCI